MDSAMKMPRLFPFLIHAAAFVIVVLGMRAASDMLVLILLAVFIATLITPMFMRMRRWGIPAALAILLLILTLLAVGLVGSAVIGRSITQFTRNLPTYQVQLQGQIAELVEWVQAQGVEVPENVTAEWLNARVAMRLMGNLMGGLSIFLSKGFVVLIVVIFILLEAAILPKKIRSAGISDAAWENMGELVESIRQYISIKTLMSVLTGLLVALMLALCQVQYAVLLGTLAFLLNYVPNIGSIAAAVPGVILALLQYGPGPAAGIGAGYLAINVGISYGLEPRYMGQGLGLSPLVVVLSLLLWGWALGPIGVFLSVPLTTVVKIGLGSVEETHGLALLLGTLPRGRGRKAAPAAPAGDAGAGPLAASPTDGGPGGGG